MNIVTCHNLLGESKEYPADELHFRISIYGIAVENDQILLVPQMDGYDIPGGAIEKGEKIEAALTREVFEETGLTATPQRLIGVYESFFVHPIDQNPYHNILIYYTCTVTGGEITDQHFDEFERKYSRKAEWIPLTAIDGLKFFNSIDTVAVIRKALTA